MVKFHFIFIVFCTLFSLKSECQTCIIVISINDTVVIGADSRIARQGYLISIDGKTSVLDFTEVCKIRTDKNVYYTGAGRGFNVLIPLAARSIAKQKILNKKINYFPNDLVKELEDSLEKTRNEDSSIYIQNYQDGFAAIIFVWYYNKLPQISQFTFKNTSKGNSKPKIEILHQSFSLPNGNRMFTMSLGNTTAVKPYLLNGNFWVQSISLSRG